MTLKDYILMFAIIIAINYIFFTALIKFVGNESWKDAAKFMLFVIGIFIITITVIGLLIKLILTII